MKKKPPTGDSPAGAIFKPLNLSAMLSYDHAKRTMQELFASSFEDASIYGELDEKGLATEETYNNILEHASDHWDSLDNDELEECESFGVSKDEFVKWAIESWQEIYLVEDEKTKAPAG